MASNWIWAVAGVLVVAAAGLGGAFWYFHRRIDPLSLLVADALAGEWADRTGRDLEQVRSAIVDGSPADVHRELVALVADVEVAFEHDGPGSVRAAVQCHYTDSGSTTTVTLKIPWARVPQPVREQFLRAGDKRSSRHWSMPQPA
jgi:hypothetical protein